MKKLSTVKKWKVNEKAWVQSVLTRLDAIEDQQPKFSKKDFDWPDWVFKVLIPLMKVTHPGLKLTNCRSWGAKDLGQFLGRQCAGESLLFGEVPLTPDKKTELENNNQVLLQARGLNTPEGLNALKKHALGMAKWRRLFRQFIDEILAEARLRPYSESSAFFAAFGKSNVYQPDDFDTEKKIGVSEKIAWLMLLFREHIAKFENIPQLHQFLKNAAEPHGIIIGLKRVEALCRRIGLRYPAKRGRPKKKNPTNPPVLA